MDYSVNEHFTSQNTIFMYFVEYICQIYLN